MYSTEWSAWNIQEVRKKRKSAHAAPVTKEDLLKLQMKLFFMTTTTLFRNLEEEGIYKITPEIRKFFEPADMYEIAISEEVPWKQWNAWLRNKIVKHLKFYKA